MRYLGAGALSLILLVMSGCSCFVKPVHIDVSRSFGAPEDKVYAVLTLADDRMIEKRQYAMMATEFKRELMGQGCEITKRDVNRIQDEIMTQFQNIMDEDRRAKIGEMTSANVLIFLHLREYDKPVYVTWKTKKNKEKKKPLRCARISFYVKAVDIETSQILWAGTLNRESGWLSGTFSSCDCDMSTLAMKTVREMAKKIAKKINKCKQAAEE